MKEGNMEIEKVNQVERMPSADNFQQALLLADTMRAELVDRGDWLQLCYAIEGLKAIKKDLDILLRSCEEDAANLLPEKKVMVDGFGVVEKRTAQTRKWQSEELLMDVCRQVLDPEQTGEIQPSRVVELIAVLKKIMPITGSLGWRVTALKEQGIDPDDYSDVSWGRKSIQITN
jgi:hypothetical protein